VSPHKGWFKEKMRKIVWKINVTFWHGMCHTCNILFTIIGQKYKLFSLKSMISKFMSKCAQYMHLHHMFFKQKYSMKFFQVLQRS